MQHRRELNSLAGRRCMLIVILTPIVFIIVNGNLSLCSNRNYLSLFNPLFSLGSHAAALPLSSWVPSIFPFFIPDRLFHLRNACLPFPCVSSCSLVPNIFPYLDPEQREPGSRHARATRYPLFRTIRYATSFRSEFFAFALVDTCSLACPINIKISMELLTRFSRGISIIPQYPKFYIRSGAEIINYGTIVYYGIIVAQVQYIEKIR